MVVYIHMLSTKYRFTVVKFHILSFRYGIVIVHIHMLRFRYGIIIFYSQMLGFKHGGIICRSTNRSCSSAGSHVRGPLVSLSSRWVGTIFRLVPSRRCMLCLAEDTVRNIVYRNREGVWSWDQPQNGWGQRVQDSADFVWKWGSVSNPLWLTRHGRTSNHWISCSSACQPSRPFSSWCCCNESDNYRSALLLGTNRIAGGPGPHSRMTHHEGVEFLPPSVRLSTASKHFVLSCPSLCLVIGRE